MKKVFGKVFDILIRIAFIFILVYLGYSLFIEEEKEGHRIVKLAGLVVTYVVYMARDKKQKTAYKKVVKGYEEQYRDIIGEAFPKDKRSYEKLLQAIVYFNTDDFQKAHKILDKLLLKCKSNKDYSAVYMFHALSFGCESKMDDGIAAYEKLLQYDATNSTAWSNLGLGYMKKGRMEEARNAYRNALMYDPDNAYAYTNLCSCCLQLGDPQQAVDYALRALALDGTIRPAMSWAAMAYQMLGDEENAEKYCRMYGANGGDEQTMRKVLNKYKK